MVVGGTPTAAGEPAFLFHVKDLSHAEDRAPISIQADY
jgi:hypothetical protein